MEQIQEHRKATAETMLNRLAKEDLGTSPLLPFEHLCVIVQKGEDEEWWMIEMNWMKKSLNFDDAHFHVFVCLDDVNSLSEAARLVATLSMLFRALF